MAPPRNTRSFAYRMQLDGAQATEEQLATARAAFDQFLSGVGAKSDEARRKFEGLGQAADRVGQRVREAGKEPPAGLKVVSDLAGEARGKLEELARQAPLVGKSLAGMGLAGIAAGAAITALSLGMAAVNAKWQEMDKIGTRLDAVLKTTGNAAGLTRRQIEDLADSLERVTLFDENQVKGAAAQLLAFKGIAGDTFREVIKLGADYAATFEDDITRSTLSIGRVMERLAGGEVKGLESAFAFLSTATVDAIRKLAETGRTAEAQTVFLDALRGAIGGAAEGQRRGIVGATKELSDEWDNLLKVLGKSPSGGLWEQFLKIQARGLNVIAGAVEGPGAGEESVRLTREILQLERDIANLERQGSGENDPRLVALQRRLALRRSEEAAIRAAAAAEQEAARRTDQQAKEQGAAAQAAREQERENVRLGNLQAFTKAQERAIEVSKQASNVREQEAAADRAVAEAKEKVGRLTAEEEKNIRRRAIEAEKNKQQTQESERATVKETAAREKNAKAIAEELENYRTLTLAIVEETAKVEERAAAAEHANTVLVLEAAGTREAKAAIAELTAAREAEKLEAEKTQAVTERLAKAREAEERAVRAATDALREELLSQADALKNSVPDLEAVFDRLIAAARRKPALDLAKDTATEGRKAIEELGKDVEREARDISGDVRNFLLDGFVDATEGGKMQFADLWDAAEKGLIRFAANIPLRLLEQQLLLPISMDLVGGAPSLFGIKTPAGAVAQGGGLLNTASNGLSLVNSANNLFGGGGSSLFSGNGLLSASNINSFFGANLFGGATTIAAGSAGAALAGGSGLAGATIGGEALAFGGMTGLGGAGGAAGGAAGALSGVAAAAPYIAAALAAAVVIMSMLDKPQAHHAAIAGFIEGTDLRVTHDPRERNDKATAEQIQSALEFKPVLDDYVAGLVRSYGVTDFNDALLGYSVRTKDGEEGATVKLLYDTAATHEPGRDQPLGIEFDPQDAQSTADAFAQLTVQLLRTAEGIAPDLKTAAMNIEATSAAEIDRQLEFARTFGQRLEYMNAWLDPVNSQLATINQQGKEFGANVLQQVRDFQEQATDLGLVADPARAREMQQGLERMVLSAMGLGPEAKELTGLELALAQGRARIEAFKDVLLELGFSAERATELIGQAQGALLLRTQAQFSEGLIARHNDAVGLGVLNTLGGIVGQARADSLTNATLYGGSPEQLGATQDVINAIFNAQVGAALEGLGDDARALQAVIDQFGQSTDAASQYIAALAQQLLDGLVPAAGGAVQALTDAGRRLVEDLAVRELRVAGDDRGALIEEGELRRERELAAALAEGLDPDQLARLAAVIDGELNAALAAFDEQVQAAADAAATAAQTAARASRDFDSDLHARELRAGGDERGAFIAELEARQRAEIEAAEAAGRTTDQIARLAAVLGLEMTAALADFDAQATGVAGTIEDLAAAAARFNADVGVRRLRVDGKTLEADLAAYDIRAAAELEEAAKNPQINLAELEAVQQDERQQIIDDYNAAILEEQRRAAEQQLAEQRRAAEEAKRIAEQAAAEQIRLAEEAARREVQRVDFNTNLLAQTLDAQGRTAEAAVVRLAGEAQQLRRQAQELGGDTSLVDAYIRARRDQLVGDLLGELPIPGVNPQAVGQWNSNLIAGASPSLVNLSAVTGDARTGTQYRYDGAIDLSGLDFGEFDSGEGVPFDIDLASLQDPTTKAVVAFHDDTNERLDTLIAEVRALRDAAGRGGAAGGGGSAGGAGRERGPYTVSQLRWLQAHGFRPDASRTIKSRAELAGFSG